MEKGEASSRYHAVGDEGIPVRDLAEVIGCRLGLPVAAKSFDEAAGHFGFLGMFLGLDAPASSALTRERLCWAPTNQGLIADLENGRYFDGCASKFSPG